jgi:hypothetical protein
MTPKMELDKLRKENYVLRNMLEIVHQLTKNIQPEEKFNFVLGDKVRKIGGDARFEGTIVSVFLKLDNETERYVVEDDRGLLMIYSPRDLMKQ